MEAHSPLPAVIFFLAASVISVPLFKKLRLGAILGYLIAGVALGPSGFNLVSHPESILHFSEIGVVLLLFVIGLELEPEKLWAMRRDIGGLGMGQLLVSALVIFTGIFLFGKGVNSAIIIGLALALSSTAFAIQLMAEKGVMATPVGRRGFAILLMQDLAVIPILFFVGAISVSAQAQSVAWYWSVSAVVGLLLVGRFALNPALKLISRYGARESMTAASLLIVVGAAFLMQEAGLSMGMGAFIAGIMLANSSFRHQLESDIEPFKGITLGLFFIAIGMTLNIPLLLQKPILLFLLAVGLMLSKTLVILGLLKLAKVEWREGICVALMLSQGGEFAFVVMSQAVAGGLIEHTLAQEVNLVVGLSMALTSPAVVLMSRLIASKPSFENQSVLASDHDHPEVLILGFGRFGQTTGRILAANRIPFVAIDKNAEHIEFVKRFGNKVYFGDATRLDMLQTAGLAYAKVVLVAVEGAGEAEQIVELIRKHSPKVHIVARAHNRASYWALRATGADHILREVYGESLNAAELTLTAMGYTESESIRTISEFKEHDLEMLDDTFEHRDDLNKLIEIGRQGREDLERLFNQDQSV